MRYNFDPKKYHFAVFDLDETLLSRGKISDFTVQTLEKLANSGVEVIIATGRALSLSPKSVTALPFIRYIISACGACVTDVSTGETLWDAPIGEDAVFDLIDRSAKYHPGCCAYYDGLIMHDLRAVRHMRLNEAPETVEAIEREFDIPVTLNIRRHIKRHHKPVIKLDLYFRTYPELADCWGELDGTPGIQLSDSPGVCIEITRKGVGKAGGLATLLEHLGAAPENVVAFGDSGNDVDMLAYAGFSVAMGSAGESVRRHADFIAPPASEDGAAKAILELFAL